MRILLLGNGSDQGRKVSDKDCLHILWSGRTRGSGQLCLEEELEKRLIQIRTEHMRWAFECGMRKPENKASARSFARRLECGISPSMWWTSLIYERHPKLSPHLFPVYKLRCLEMLIHELGVSSLEVRGCDRMLEGALGDLCSSLRIGFSASNGKKLPKNSNFLKRIYEFFPAPVRAGARYLFWLIQVRGIMPATSRRSFSSGSKKEKADALIVSYFPNIDLKAAAKGRYRSRYWENLHELLNKEAERENPAGGHFVHWVFIRFPSPELSLRQCLDLCKEFTKTGKDGASFNYLEQFLTTGGQCKSIWRWMRLCVASMVMEREFAESCHFKGSKLNFWPYFRQEWAESMRGWRALERCLQNEAFRHLFHACGERRWVLFPLENCPWERMLTEAARDGKTRIPVYGAQHSIIRPTDFRYFDAPETFSTPECAVFQPDVFGANGQSARTQWSENGMPDERLKVLEALRYQYLTSEKSEVKRKETSLPPAPGEPLELPGERLLVVTSFFADETAAHLALLKDTLVTGLLSGWRVLIKPHPYLAVEEWRDNLPKDLASKVEIIGTPLSLALLEGGLVWASNSTTAALEAALLGLPTMVMSPVGDFDLCPIQNVDGLARTSTVDDVKKFLKEKPVPILPQNYLDLTSGLEQWRGLLGFDVASA